MRKWIKAIFIVLGVFLILEIVISLLPNRGILRAIREKNLSAVKQSIAKGADVNKLSLNGKTPLISASELGNAQIVQELLKAGVKPNMVGKGNTTSLLAARAGGYTEIVSTLLQYGANPNIADIQGLSPLIIASKRTY